MYIFSATSVAPTAPPSWDSWVQFPQSQVALVSLAIVAFTAVAGWISAVSAFRSAGNARKNLGVATASFDLNKASSDATEKELEADFTKAVAIRRPYGTTYVFDMEVTNPATRANTVKKAPLTLIFDDGAKGSFDPKPPPGEMRSKAMSLPLELAASAHKGGTLSYEVSGNFVGDRLIRRFRIDVTDVSGRKTPVETIQVEVKS